MNRVLSVCKRYRRPLGIAFLALLCLGILACIWLTAVLPAQSKSQSIKLNDQYDQSLVLTEPLTQTFTTDRPLVGLGFQMRAEGTCAGTLHLELYNDDTGELLSISTGDLAYLVPDGYTVMGLDTPVAAGTAERYRLVLTAEYTDGSAQATVGFGTDGLDGTLYLGDTPVSGSLALLAVTEQIGGFVSAYFWAFGLLATALICLCATAVTGPRPWPLHRLCFVLVLAFGLLFTMLLPPYSVPDEQYHINQAFTLASRISTHLAPDGYPIGAVPIQETFRRATDQGPLLQDANTTVFTWREYLRQLDSRSDEKLGQIVCYNELQASSDNTLYLVSGLAVLLGYMLHLGFAPTLLLGRLANLLVFALLTAWAVKRAPFGKRVFLAVALLPMTLHLAASFSRDSLLLGLVFAFTALVLDAAWGPAERIRPVHLAALAILPVLFAPAKMVYLPLAALMLLIPAARIGRRGNWFKAGVLVLAVLAFCLSPTNRLTLEGIWTTDTSSVSAAPADAQPEQTVSPAPESTAQSVTEPEAEAAEPDAAEEEPPAESGPTQGLVAEQDKATYSVSYILHNPGTTLKLFVNTLLENTDHYIRSLVGGSLSYYTLDLAWGWVLVLYGLLAAALLGGGSPMPARARLWTGLLCLFCLGLTVGGCLVWTPIYYTTLYGLQGRYLLCFLPAALLALRPAQPRLAAGSAHGLVLAFVLVDAGVLLNVFLAVLAR
ncbi:MAG TPA: DUF2142 domain-containing protein [Candidatus Gemmiger avium]|nr:DUF2142 domain-containing protein [Candidatus Gemmiger avium]